LPALLQRSIRIAVSILSPYHEKLDRNHHCGGNHDQDHDQEDDEPPEWEAAAPASALLI
jgi:hypothetical protein